MALLKHEHIIDMILSEYYTTDERSDFNDEYYVYSAILILNDDGRDPDKYKVVIMFYEKFFLMYVFRIHDGSHDAFTELDCIFRFRETDAGEYAESPEIPYDSGDFVYKYGYAVEEKFKELSIETQIISGSFYSKYVGKE